MKSKQQRKIYEIKNMSSRQSDGGAAILRPFPPSWTLPQGHLALLQRVLGPRLFSPGSWATGTPWSRSVLQAHWGRLITSVSPGLSPLSVSSGFAGASPPQLPHVLSRPS